MLSSASGKVSIAAGLLGGTVVAIDMEARELVLQMPEGHTTVFSTAQAEMLKDVKIGDRVSIELDQNGKVVKLVKLPVDPGN
ncbi:MAG TPA: hypothetical protein VHF07_05330 [Nitrospiraceae bacterium]|nr:hypothetical protein [Nitrospiraceae bacterium]